MQSVYKKGESVIFLFELATLLQVLKKRTCCFKRAGFTQHWLLWVFFSHQSRTSEV